MGKTTLVKALAETLQEREGLNTLVVSIDDFYLTHEDQLKLAEENSDNALVQYRGEPGELLFLCGFVLSLGVCFRVFCPEMKLCCHPFLGDPYTVCLLFTSTRIMCLEPLQKQPFSWFQWPC